jgi:trigger factor
MKTTINKLSDTKLELTITLGKKELDDAKQVAVTKLSKELKVSGFRQGKVPAEVAIKNIDPAKLDDQLLNDAISKAVADAFIENKLQALERPAVEVKKYVPGESVEFTAESEVLPEVKLGDYKNLKTKKQTASVKAADINEVLERMQKGLGKKETVKRAAKNGDEVLIDFVGKKDGTPFEGGAADDYTLELGSNSFIPGFEEAIVGHKASEDFDIDITFPDEYQVADLAGQKVIFSVKLKDVKEVKLPELNDEFAAQTGPFTSLQELKDSIKTEISQQKEREATDKLKDEMISELVKVSTVPIPDVLVQDQSKAVEQDFEQNLMYRGQKIEDFVAASKYKDAEDWRKQEVVPAAERRVAASLVLAELSKKEKVTATEQELETQLQTFQQQYANSPEAMEQLKKPEVKQDIANRLLTEKTLERLVELNS